MSEKQDKNNIDAQAPEKVKVVLVSIPSDISKYEVIKSLASNLGLAFDEATEIINKLPVELLPSVPVEAGEKFAENIRESGAEVDVLPIGVSSGRFCTTHTHRRARARCKEPGCDKYICEIEIRDSGGKLYCPTCYKRFKRRRLLISLSAVLGVIIVVFLWFSYGSAFLRTMRYLSPVSTNEIALVCVTRNMDEKMAQFYMDAVSSESPGRYQDGDSHKISEIDGWFQKEYERLTGGELNIVEVDLYGMYQISGDVPSPSRSKKFTLEGMKANRAFRNFFKDIIKANRLNLKAYDYVLFVEVAYETGIKNDFIEYLGMVHDDIGYVVIPLDGVYSDDYYVMAIGHYIARLMGASVHLDQHGYPVFPQGYADPNLTDRYPQTNTELMGGYTPAAAYQVQRINSLDQVVLGYYTAFEIGWLSRSTMEGAYVAAKPEP